MSQSRLRGKTRFLIKSNDCSILNHKPRQLGRYFFKIIAWDQVSLCNWCQHFCSRWYDLFAVLGRRFAPPSNHYLLKALPHRSSWFSLVLIRRCQRYRKYILKMLFCDVFFDEFRGRSWSLENFNFFFSALSFLAVNFLLNVLFKRLVLSWQLV